MGNDKIKQNALLQKAGDVYHYYIAIKVMLENNNWNQCTIEESGDIALLDENGLQLFNFEVKHHNENKELKIYEEEFQKTLFNWFNIKNIFDDNTKLILMTSSTVSIGNSLEYWNEYTSDKKYKTLLENQKKNNLEYYSSIKKYFLPINKSSDKLKNILEKIEIQHSLSNIVTIKDKIKETSHFRLFGTNKDRKDKVIDELYGLIARGLENKEKWEITKNGFDQKLIESTTLIQSKILRTNTSISSDSFETDVGKYKEKQFIKKLENIEFEEDVFQLAIDDYAKATIELADRMNLKTSLEYDERLKDYDDSLIKIVNEKKTEYRYKNDLNYIEKSQSSYWQIMNAPKIPFMPEEFDDQTTFFQKGYLHILADDEEKPRQICWSLKPKDLI